MYPGLVWKTVIGEEAVTIVAQTCGSLGISTIVRFGECFEFSTRFWFKLCMYDLRHRGVRTWTLFFRQLLFDVADLVQPAALLFNARPCFLRGRPQPRSAVGDE